MLESGPAVQAAALDEAKALGADVIRANVIWSRYGAVATARRRSRRSSTARTRPRIRRACSTSSTPSSRACRPAACSRCSRPPGRSRSGRRAARARPRSAASASPTRSCSARSCAPRQALPDGEAVVDLERAEPRLVALAAVRGGRQQRCDAVGRPVPLAGRFGDRRPARYRASQGPDPARRDRPAGRRSVGLLARAVVQEARAAAATRSASPRRRRSCATSCASPPAASGSPAPPRRPSAAAASRSSP